MLLRQKLKICSVVAVVGVIFVTISFISPGWIISTFEDHDTYGVPEKGDRYTKEGHMSIGPWYVFLCLVKLSKTLYGWYSNELQEKCSMVPTVHLRESVFPEEFVDWFYNRTLVSTGNSILEMQTISTIGIVFALLGSIATVVYTRRLAKSKCTGLLACISLSISGGIYSAAMLRTFRSYHFCKLDYRSNFIAKYPREDVYYDVYFHCPWSLVLGGIGSLLILISAVGLLLILTRNNTGDDIHVYQMTNGEDQDPDREVVLQSSQTKCTCTIVPSGYKEAVGLKSPLVDSKENERDSFFDS